MVGGGRLNRREPNRLYTQILQIIQSGSNAIQVTDAVVVGVTEGADEDFVANAGSGDGAARAIVW